MDESLLFVQIDIFKSLKIRVKNSDCYERKVSVFKGLFLLRLRRGD